MPVFLERFHVEPLPVRVFSCSGFFYLFSKKWGEHRVSMFHVEHLGEIRLDRPVKRGKHPA